MDFQQLLSQLAISSERIEQLGLGIMGVVFNIHVLLDEQGRRTDWLVKRLRTAYHPQPEEAFARFEQEHRIMEQYFGQQRELSWPSLLPETHFIVLNYNFDDHPDHQGGREFVVLQQYVRGCSFKQLKANYPDRLPDWLNHELSHFITRYRRMQREALAIPDLFRLESDHIKIDESEQRLWVFDTNNLTQVLPALEQNPLFLAHCPKGRSKTPPLELLHQVFDSICQLYEFDRKAFYSPRKDLDLAAMRELLELTNYFPLDEGDNPYLAKLRQIFPV